MIVARQSDPEVAGKLLAAIAQVEAAKRRPVYVVEICQAMAQTGENTLVNRENLHALI